MNKSNIKTYYEDWIADVYLNSADNYEQNTEFVPDTI